MMDLDPKILLAVGFFLLVLGVLLPFLMVLQILESTLFLNFFSFIAQFLGLIVGFIGAMSLARRSHRRDR
jgi:positive regulator of sigma E activity